ERQLYDDNNAINTAYAWLLAPVAKGQSGIVQIGYSFAAQDAEHTRWQIAQPVQPYPITDDRVRTNGRYVPYYTPLNLLSHSILGAATTHPTSRVTFHLDGSFAVRATDDAPVIVVVGTTPADASLATTTWKRSFNPWTGRGALDIASSSALSLGVAGEVMHTAYYTGTIVRLQATFRFAGSAKSRPVR
ncbi:MAG: hypothetical protein ABIT38_11990, partial [Gemmatimonadaceae bacterium]